MNTGQTERMPLQRDSLTAFVIFVLIFALYLWSMPGTVVLEDDGLFILAGWFNGIAHPPGYPLYTVLASVATHLPLPMSVAWKAHALSAMFGALACAVLFLIARQWLDNRLAAIVAAAAYGVSEVFWSQSIIAEVYSLNSLLFFIAVWLCLRFHLTTRTGYLYAAAFVTGLGLSNHWPLFVLAGPLLLGMVWPWRWITVRILATALACLTLGLTPYVWMVMRSQMDPAISFYGPIRSWYEFWFVVSRAGYSGADASLTAGWYDKWQFLLFFIRQFIFQFGLPGFVLVLIGLMVQRRYWRLPVVIGMLLAFLGNTVLLIMMLGFDYDLMHRLVFRVFPHIAYGLAALWLGAGFLACHESIQKKITGGVVINGLAVLIMGSALLANLPLNYRASDIWTDNYARTVLNHLEPDAAIFTYGEVTTAPLAYLNKIEGYRPDVEIFNGQGLVLGNRLYSFNEPEEQIRQKNDRFIEQMNRPVYFMGDFANSYANYHYGLFLKVNKADREKHTVYRKDPAIYNDLFQLIQHAPRDPWQKMTYDLLVVDFCRISFQMLQSVPDTRLSAESIAPRCRNFQGYLMLAGELVGADKPDLPLLKQFIDRAEESRSDATDKKSLALHDYHRGFYFSQTGDTKEAEEAWRRSLTLWPDAENPVRELLK